jgi:hypothetical protein
MAAAENNQIPNDLFKLDSLASSFISHWNRGEDLPGSQKEMLLGKFVT